MVCKEDVVSWFKELESYKRIDAMCTLLNMCLPFELRFIGTYLEELGKRDFQELRGAELRANNPTDLAADIGGANTDPRTRRKMALYVSLLRSCNFACATTLYNAMVSLEQSGLLKGLYGDLLEEILLLYTMALHHPAFTFDQKSHFGEILDKLKMEDQRLQFQEPDLVSVAPGLCHSQSVSGNMSVPPPNLTNLGPPPGIMYIKSPNIQPQNTEPVPPELNSPPVLTSSGTVVSLPLGDVTHPPPGLPLPPYSMPEYMGQHPWPTNILVSPLTQVSQPLEVINYLSGSPPASRASSPSSRRRHVSHVTHVTHATHGAHPPPDRTPPHTDSHTHAHLAANFENLTVNDMRNMSDDRLRDIRELTAARYQSLEKLNGVRRRGPLTRSSSDSASSSPSPPPPRAPLPPHPPAVLPPFPRTFGFPPPPPYARPPPPFANGEPPPHFPAQYGGYVPVVFAPPKLSCWNCGGAGHAGHECSEPSMEEMTRAGGYQLDFGQPPDHDK